MARGGRLFVAVLIAALVVVAVVWFVRPQSSSDSPVSGRGATEEQTSLTPAAPARERREPGAPAISAATPLPLANPEDRSPLADSLHNPQQNPGEDLAVVLGLFDYYQRTFGGLPSGESNAQLVNALTGNNPQRIALIDRSHPAINARGELTDRWGSPLFFHLIARDALEIRSAGPDKTLWSDDDLLTASPRLRALKPQD